MKKSNKAKVKRHPLQGILACPVSSCRGMLQIQECRAVCKSCTYKSSSSRDIWWLLSKSDTPQEVLDIATYYDGSANRKDELDETYEGPYDVQAWDLENEIVDKYINSLKPKVVVDLGCGFYPHSWDVTAEHVICVDVSVRSLHEAKVDFPSEKCERDDGSKFTNHYICGDALNLPLANDSVPAIIAGGELVNHLNFYDMLRECYRVMKPGGRMTVSVSLKHCIDTAWSVLDAFIGNKIGYSMTRDEAVEAVRKFNTTSYLTWEVNPGHDLKVKLYTRKDLLKSISTSGFKLMDMRSMYNLSGVLPMPIHQHTESRDKLSPLTLGLLKTLLEFDREVLGRYEPFRWFGANAFLVLEKPL